MLVKPDFSEIKDEVGPGTYRVRVVKGEPGEWQSGTKYVAWSLSTTDEAEAKNNGRMIFYRTPITGKGAFMFQRLYKALTGEAITGEFDTEQLYGRECVVTVADGKDKEGNPTGYTEVVAVRAV